MTTLIREDRFGPYLRTGGYLFRPGVRRRVGGVPRIEELSFSIKNADGVRVTVYAGTTAHGVGAKVPARHVGGTEYAIVGGEVWMSHGESARWDATTQRSVWNVSTECYEG
jgi:hypothetical protein